MHTSQSKEHETYLNGVGDIPRRLVLVYLHLAPPLDEVVFGEVYGRHGLLLRHLPALVAAIETLLGLVQLVRRRLHLFGLGHVAELVVLAGVVGLCEVHLLRSFLVQRYFLG